MIIALKDVVHASIIETIVTLPETYKLFPTDLLTIWFEKDPKETISVLSGLCKVLCDSDSRDLTKVCSDE